MKEKWLLLTIKIDSFMKSGLRLSVLALLALVGLSGVLAIVTLEWEEKHIGVWLLAIVACIYYIFFRKRA